MQSYEPIVVELIVDYDDEGGCGGIVVEVVGGVGDGGGKQLGHL